MECAPSKVLSKLFVIVLSSSLQTLHIQTADNCLVYKQGLCQSSCSRDMSDVKSRVVVTCYKTPCSAIRISLQQISCKHCVSGKKMH